MSTEVKDEIKRYILETYLFTSDPSALGDEESFLDRGIIDSTGVLELIMFLEEQFGVTIADDELLPENLDSVNRVAAFVERKRAGA
jgi:acyl carrier protein